MRLTVNGRTYQLDISIDYVDAYDEYPEYFIQAKTDNGMAFSEVKGFGFDSCIYRLAHIIKEKQEEIYNEY